VTRGYNAIKSIKKITCLLISLTHVGSYWDGLKSAKAVTDLGWHP